MRDILVLQGVFGGGWGAGAAAPPPAPAAVTVFRHPHHPTIPTFGRVLWMALLLLFILPSPVQADGYFKLGMWPRHNEDILNSHAEINKYRAELSQRFRVSLIELELNPVFIFGGDWPKRTQSYKFDWINAEYNVVIRVFVFESVNLFYHKRLYRDVYNITDSVCNCTYSNEVGLQYNW